MGKVFQSYMARKMTGINYLLSERYKEEPVENLDGLCNPNLCAGCRGNCCKGFPCTYAPTDFLSPSENNFRAILKVGPIVVSRIKADGLDTFYTLRPMSKGDNNRIVNWMNDAYLSPSSYCMLLDWKSGCMLPRDYRPTGGLLLTPTSYGRKCKGHFSILEQYYAWENYQELLKELAFEFRKEEFNGEVTSKHVKQIKKIMRRK